MHAYRRAVLPRRVASPSAHRPIADHLLRSSRLSFAHSQVAFARSSPASDEKQEQRPASQQQHLHSSSTSVSRPSPVIPLQPAPLRGLPAIAPSAVKSQFQSAPHPTQQIRDLEQDAWRTSIGLVPRRICFAKRSPARGAVCGFARLVCPMRWLG